ncbi:MAG: hypothetical protein ACRETY_10825, partial [Steroidobacteraceae bacterium]
LIVAVYLRNFSTISNFSAILRFLAGSISNFSAILRFLAGLRLPTFFFLGAFFFAALFFVAMVVPRVLSVLEPYIEVATSDGANFNVSPVALANRTVPPGCVPILRLFKIGCDSSVIWTVWFRGRQALQLVDLQ